MKMRSAWLFIYKAALLVGLLHVVYLLLFDQIHVIDAILWVGWNTLFGALLIVNRIVAGLALLRACFGHINNAASPTLTNQLKSRRMFS